MAACPGDLEEKEDTAPEVLPDDLGVLQGEDTGLGQLARRVAAEAMEGADGAAGHSDRSPDANPPELQQLEVGPLKLQHSSRNLACCKLSPMCKKPGSQLTARINGVDEMLSSPSHVQGVEMLAMHRHGELLGGNEE